MRNLILMMTLLGALYVLWGMGTPPPSPSIRADASAGDHRPPARDVTPQGAPPQGPERELIVGQLEPEMTGSAPSFDVPPPGVDPLNETVVDAPLDEPPQGPQPEVTPRKWVPSRSDDALSAYGLLGLYTGWLKEAERIGWVASSDALSVTREGVTIHFTSKDGLLQGAEVSFAPDAMSDMAMDLPHTLLGSEAVGLSLEPPFERETAGWRESRRVALPSGRTVELTVQGRSVGEPPFGPERLLIEITNLRR